MTEKIQAIFTKKFQHFLGFQTFCVIFSQVLCSWSAKCLPAGKDMTPRVKSMTEKIHAIFAKKFHENISTFFGFSNIFCVIFANFMFVVREMPTCREGHETEGEEDGREGLEGAAHGEHGAADAGSAAGGQQRQQHGQHLRKLGWQDILINQNSLNGHVMVIETPIFVYNYARDLLKKSHP